MFCYITIAGAVLNEYDELSILHIKKPVSRIISFLAPSIFNLKINNPSPWP